MKPSKYNLKVEKEPKGKPLDVPDISTFEEHLITKVLHIPTDISVFTDKQTKVKTIALPIVFPLGENGIISITHLTTLPWFPSEDIESVTIKFRPL
jgi:hypothetical protein